MDWKPFWKIIEDSYRPDPVDHFEALKERLEPLKWFEVVEFQARFDEAIAAANLLALWGAAHLINGSCSDDALPRLPRLARRPRAGTPTSRRSRTPTPSRTSSTATRWTASASTPRRCASTRRRPG